MYKKTNEKFINPYHFVPVEGRCIRQEGYLERKNKGDLTGYIEIELTNLTPIFIPNSSNSNVFNHKEIDGKSYDFFSYTDLKDTNNPEPPKNPVIPGSELRGVIRSTYETLTNSCFSAISKDIISRRTEPFTGSNCGCGVIKKKDGKWIFEECYMEPLPIKKYDFLKEAKHGEFRKINSKEGYIFKGEKTIKERKNYYLFIPKGKSIELDNETVERFKKVMDDYKDESKNQKLKEGHGGYVRNVVKDVYLVYYRKVNDKYYFSPAQVGREAYYNTFVDILKKNGEFQPCTDKNKLCEACLLFGYVAEGKTNESASSRIRFTDLTYSGNRDPEYFKPLYLKELASPKPTAIEFYLKKPKIPNLNVQWWNYDYIIYKDKEGRKVKPYDPQLMGRKYYWHIPDCNENHFREKEDKVTFRNVMVRPLKPNHTFTGKIYFEDLTKLELKRILWILTFGNSERHAHKIGMGKPYGLGSVKIKINGVYLKKIEVQKDNENIEVSYSLEKQDLDYTNLTYKDFGCSKNTFKDYLTICEFSKKQSPIEYPKNKDSENIFEWFAANRKGVLIRIDQNLTDSPIAKPELVRYEKSKGGKQNAKKNYFNMYGRHKPFNKH